jgi:hypothetical protein
VGVICSIYQAYPAGCHPLSQQQQLTVPSQLCLAGLLARTARFGMVPTWFMRKSATQRTHAAAWRQACSVCSGAGVWQAKQSAAQQAISDPQCLTTTLPTPMVSSLGGMCVPACDRVIKAAEQGAGK